MRYHQIITEKVDVSSVEFRSWFGKSKVVDSAGRPLLCYHGTAFGDEITHFQTLSHFGTLRAAQDRIADKLDEPRPIMHPDYGREHAPHIYPVYLRIVRPVQIPDCGMPPYGKFDPACILRSLVKQKIITNKRAKEIKRIWTVLRELGYDGAYYVKREEDRGSTSWIIFDSNQVWPLYRDAPDG